MQSKYLGKVYDGFEVVNYYMCNNYKKRYGREKKPVEHRAYNYELYNDHTKQHLTLSGNQIRILESGKRTIHQMLTSNAFASKNPRINAYFKWLRS